ncbi:hypothetical protein ES703_110920 [subsurface metagenome]
MRDRTLILLNGAGFIGYDFDKTVRVARPIHDNNVNEVVPWFIKGEGNRRWIGPLGAALGFTRAVPAGIRFFWADDEHHKYGACGAGPGQVSQETRVGVQLPCFSLTGPWIHEVNLKVIVGKRCVYDGVQGHDVASSARPDNSTQNILAPLQFIAHLVPVVAWVCNRIAITVGCNPIPQTRYNARTRSSGGCAGSHFRRKGIHQVMITQSASNLVISLILKVLKAGCRPGGSAVIVGMNALVDPRYSLFKFRQLQVGVVNNCGYLLINVLDGNQ